MVERCEGVSGKGKAVKVSEVEEGRERRIKLLVL